jgi:hypothetical protein
MIEHCRLASSLLQSRMNQVLKKGAYMKKAFLVFCGLALLFILINAEANGALTEFLCDMRI